MDSKDLFEIEPSSDEIEFEFELKKQSTSFIRIINKSDEYVGFRITSNVYRSYLIRPNIGVLEPKTNRNVKIIMLATFIPPRDLKSCEDELWIERRIVPPWATIDDLKRIDFSDEEGAIDRTKLRVVIHPTTSSSSATNIPHQSHLAKSS